MTTTTASANVVSKFSKEFYTVVGIYDAKTQVFVGRIATTTITRCRETATSNAMNEAFDFVEKDLAKRWWCKRYKITASQFDAMLQDEVIDPLESFTFKVEEQRIYKLNPKG